MVPKAERASIAIQFSRFTRNDVPIFAMVTAATMAAIKFRKKLFCIKGRSPDSFTSMFMLAKPKEEIKIYSTAFCLLNCTVFPWSLIWKTSLPIVALTSNMSETS